jgi:predicted metal-binding protein
MRSLFSLLGAYRAALLLAFAVKAFSVEDVVDLEARQSNSKMVFAHFMARVTLLNHLYQGLTVQLDWHRE